MLPGGGGEFLMLLKDFMETLKQQIYDADLHPETYKGGHSAKGVEGELRFFFRDTEIELEIQEFEHDRMMGCACGMGLNIIFKEISD
jgi:hypothetical protein